MKKELQVSFTDVKPVDIKAFPEMQELLKDIGICLDYNAQGNLDLIITKDYYGIKSRNAGRHRRVSNVTYADIIYMLNQGMTDKTILQQIGMASATYFRHKKDMVQSDYYRRLDKDRLNDLDYLRQGVTGEDGCNLDKFF